MFAHFFSPKNLSQKVMRVIFSIYLAVTCLITGVQFLTEYLKTQDSILKELRQLEETVSEPISTSLWQYNQNQLNVLVTGILKMPIVEGVDIFDKNTQNMISQRSFAPDSAPILIFEVTSDLSWNLNEKEILLGSLVLYSSSDVILDRVLFGFTLIAITVIIKISVFFCLFIWAFDRFLAIPLKELMSQVDEIQLSHNTSMRLKLSGSEKNELNQLQDHINKLLSVIEMDRERLIEDEADKRVWLEQAVAECTQELQILNEELKQLATKDSLTGVLNRKSFFETAQHLLVLSQRQKSSACFILMDLDHFKIINDTHGHFIGDKVLVHFTQTIQKFLRKSDLFCRVGGEEFAIFLPDTAIENAFELANKLRKTIANSILEIDGKTINYTVSLGIDVSEQKDLSIDELFKRADLKLYEAKDKGRDRVEI